MTKEKLDMLLRCTMCTKKQETLSEITYSRGDRVCLDCKKKS